MLEKNDVYALQLIKYLGPKKIENLTEAYSHINDIISASEDDLNQYIKGAGKDSIISEIKNNFDKYLKTADYDLEQFEYSGITLISKSCEEYPNSLRVIDKSPPFLYCKGNTNLLKEENSIAVIGSRNATIGGKEIAYKTTLQFLENDYNIVSGLASGIDTAGHTAAVTLKKKTTAVLVAIDTIYPKENQVLSDSIIDFGGLLIAENKPGTPITGPLFVERDRLQSALSKAVFAIETDIKGGTLHTVRFAEKQKKKIYCPNLREEQLYKNHIGNPMSKGIDMLIQSGRAIPYSTDKLDKVIKEVDKLRIEGDITVQPKTSEGRQESFI